MIEDTRLRLLAALGHCVEVLDDLKPCGHSGEEETGEHDLCRVEAALAHAEEEGGVKGGIEPSSPLSGADVPPPPPRGLYLERMRSVCHLYLPAG